MQRRLGVRLAGAGKPATDPKLALGLSSLGSVAYVCLATLLVALRPAVSILPALPIGPPIGLC